MIIPEGTDVLKYCQESGLRILAGHALQFFDRHLEDAPGNYLEIGVFEGYMLRFLATEYPSKKFFGIDPFIEDGNTTGHNGVPFGQPTPAQRLAAHDNLDGLSNVTLFEQTSVSFAAETDDATLESMNIGSVFVDGSHHYPDVINDLELALRALSNGGVIFVDDLSMPDVEWALADFLCSHCDRVKDVNALFHVRPKC